MMGRETALLRRIGIYAVANFGSKVMSYVTVLLYSYYIQAKELGYYDLVNTTVSALMPLILLQVNDGAYRYILEAKEDRQKYIRTGMSFVALTASVASVLFACLNIVYKFKYALWILLFLVTTAVYTFVLDVVRALGDNKFYAGIGVVNTFVILFLELFGLVVLKRGVEVLLASHSVANILCIALMACKERALCLPRISAIDGCILKKLLVYSVPLIPNVVCWWIVNFSDRYLILHYLGLTANGIYSMANKFPSILIAVTGVFFTAWQETAIKEYSSQNRDAFFSGIFYRYSMLLFGLAAFLIPATRIVASLFLSREYMETWKYTGFLYMGSVFSALCSFLGVGYQISKETARAFFSTVGAAAVNFLVNIALIRRIGIHAASLSTFVAYFFLFVYRMGDSRRYFCISPHYGKWLAMLGLCGASLVITFVSRNLAAPAIAAALGAASVLCFSRGMIKRTVKSIRGLS